MRRLAQRWGNGFVWRFLLVLFLVTCCTFFSWRLLGARSLGIDDAYIFFVYAHNLVEGHGIVYNPGGERVEGYTSFLWMLLAALVFAFRLQPEWPLLILSVLLLSSAVTVLWQYIEIDGEGKKITWRGLIFLLWVFSSPGFVIWNTLTLMDTVLWTVLLILATVALLSDVGVTVWRILIVLLLLTRPEGVVWVPFFLILNALKYAVNYGVFVSWHRVRGLVFQYFSLLGCMTIFRLLYFGYPLPNTFYAKVSPDLMHNMKMGGVYLLGFILFNVQVLPSIVTLLTGVLANSFGLVRQVWRHEQCIFERAKSGFFYSCLVGLLGLTMPLLTGGDHFDFFRFYQPVWPILFLPCLGLIDVLRDAISKVPAVLRKGVGVGFLVLCFFLPHNGWLSRESMSKFQYEFTLAQDGRQLGVALNAMFPDEKPSVGVIAAGGVAFIYEGFVVDVMGLNNVEVAHTPGNRYGFKNHAAFNPDVFLKQRPDLLLHHSDRFMAELFCDPRFSLAYEFATISDGQIAVDAYVEKGYLRKLLELGFGVELVGISLNCSR